jgi:hypothetical protein
MRFFTSLAMVRSSDRSIGLAKIFSIALAIGLHFR